LVSLFAFPHCLLFLPLRCTLPLCPCVLFRLTPGLVRRKLVAVPPRTFRFSFSRAVKFLSLVFCFAAVFFSSKVWPPDSPPPFWWFVCSSGKVSRPESGGENSGLSSMNCVTPPSVFLIPFCMPFVKLWIFVAIVDPFPPFFVPAFGFLSHPGYLFFLNGPCPDVFSFFAPTFGPVTLATFFLSPSDPTSLHLVGTPPFPPVPCVTFSPPPVFFLTSAPVIAPRGVPDAVFFFFFYVGQKAYLRVGPCSCGVTPSFSGCLWRAVFPHSLRGRFFLWATPR